MNRGTLGIYRSNGCLRRPFPEHMSQWLPRPSPLISPTWGGILIPSLHHCNWLACSTHEDASCKSVALMQRCADAEPTHMYTTPSRQTQGLAAALAIQRTSARSHRAVGVSRRRELWENIQWEKKYLMRHKNTVMPSKFN